MRIVVVDDLRDAADSFALMLKAMGHDALTAYDGLEAVQAVAAFKPETIEALISQLSALKR